MITVPQLAQTLQTLLTTTAAAAARTSGWTKRASKLTGAAFVQTLALGWLGRPQASLSELTQTAASVGVAIRPQGLDQRCTEAGAACLHTVLEAAVQAVLAADPVAIPLLQRFTAVAVQDSSTIALPDALATVWPGCGERTGHAQAALKLHVRLDLLGGRLVGPLLTSGRTSDKASPLQAVPLPPGALSLADLGFFALDRLQELDAQGVYWLSRLQVQTAVFDAQGRRLDLPRWLPRTGPAVLDLPVRLGADHRLPARLLAVRVPPEVAAERRRKLHAEARHKGQTVSQARLALADWTLLVTNVPPARLTVAEALVLARARWQIELLFKLWKEHGHVDESRSDKPWRILCEVYAKLLGVLIQHWCVLVGGWALPDRSLVKMAQTVRAHAVLLASAFRGVLSLVAALAQLRDCLAVSSRVNRRRKAPSTCQLLLHPPDLHPSLTTVEEVAA